MKTNNRQLDSDELWIKSMMEEAKREPSENLSYRIMHQIETERALARNKEQLSKDKGDVLIDFRNIFGLMYLALLIAGIIFYTQGGKEALFADTFLWTCVTISSVFSIFFLISTADNLLRKKKTRF